MADTVPVNLTHTNIVFTYCSVPVNWTYMAIVNFTITAVENLNYMW